MCLLCLSGRRGDLFILLFISQHVCHNFFIRQFSYSVASLCFSKPLSFVLDPPVLPDPCVWSNRYASVSYLPVVLWLIPLALFIKGCECKSRRK